MDTNTIMLIHNLLRTKVELKEIALHNFAGKLDVYSKTQTHHLFSLIEPGKIKTLQ